MRIFVTGASGHIGSAVTWELLAHGHEVTGLARSEASASKLSAAGAAVHRGRLEDLEGLRRVVAESDAVAHLAYDHALAFGGTSDGYREAAERDLGAIRAIGNALEGSGKPLVTTGGTALFAFAGLTRPLLEDDVLPAGPRVDSENATLALSEKGVRSSVVRLPPVVHSSADRDGFIPTLIKMARRNGFSAYVGDGANVWPAVHTSDAARLYRLAIEAAPIGARLHGVAEGGTPFRSIAEAIGKGLGLPARSVNPDEAPQYVGFLAGFAKADNPASSARTRALLGWEPSHAGVLEDIAGAHYWRA
jgi:nucleoside-diphosphate-sugar epimerase